MEADKTSRSCTPLTHAACVRTPRTSRTLRGLEVKTPTENSWVLNFGGGWLPRKQFNVDLIAVTPVLFLSGHFCHDA